MGDACQYQGALTNATKGHRQAAPIAAVDSLLRKLRRMCTHARNKQKVRSFAAPTLQAAGTSLKQTLPKQ
jgi:hypothetical protein